MRKTRIRIAIKAAVLLAAAFLLYLKAGILIYHDRSMFPSVRDGDLCIAWKKGGYKSQEIVIYQSEGTLQLGRIEAGPGDTVNITNTGNLTVNDSVPYETIYYRSDPDPDSGLIYPLQLGRGEYFVVNDYREQFGDSRSQGPISSEAIKGSVFLIVRHRGF
ncbi:MAG: signal peptidase I [Erysipelotrichaceae bacterium]|nr:signal peptidase I [Erysipelotrichaceae bacterium]